ncbi:MAG TPA: hypothetical protein VL551_11625 [Actinospica sp.]|jgi:hypothetical protein|nr:hypothetical protein [Actinospica sp.]
MSQTDQDAQLTASEWRKASACYFAWMVGVEAAIGAPIGYLAVDLPGPWLGMMVLAVVIPERFEPQFVRRQGERLFGFEYWKPIDR